MSAGFGLAAILLLPALLLPVGLANASEASIMLENQTAEPIKVYVNDHFDGTLAPGEKRVLRIPFGLHRLRVRNQEAWAEETLELDPTHFYGWYYVDDYGLTGSVMEDPHFNGPEP